jgi:hypothetical protein
MRGPLGGRLTEKELLMQGKSVLLVLGAVAVLVSDVGAQQHRDWPLCGILAIDTLGSIRPRILVRAGREEPLGKALPQLTASLQTTIERVVAPLMSSADSASTGRNFRESQEATLLLQLSISLPQRGVAAVGGTWLLLLGLHPSWQRSVPLQVISADSLIEGAHKVGVRLIEELPAYLQRCRQLDKMRLRLN